MSLDNDCVEAIAYPLLFLEGEKGYNFTAHKKLISFNRYVCQRLLRPELDINGSFLTTNTPYGDYTLSVRVNRFQLLARVMQVILFIKYIYQLKLILL